MVNGWVCGSWDLLHPGHMILLAECRKNCDHLYIGFHTDPTIDRPEKNKPIETVFERWYRLINCLSASGCTIIPYETEADLQTILRNYPIDIRFLGSDYIGKDFTGKEIEWISIHYCDRDHGYSSSGLRERIENAGKK